MGTVGDQQITGGRNSPVFRMTQKARLFGRFRKKVGSVRWENSIKVELGQILNFEGRCIRQSRFPVAVFAHHLAVS